MSPQPLLSASVTVFARFLSALCKACLVPFPHVNLSIEMMFQISLMRMMIWCVYLRCGNFPSNWMTRSNLEVKLAQMSRKKISQHPLR